MKFILITLFLFYCFMPNKAFADAMKASELAEVCQSEVGQVICLPYIRGALETNMFFDNSPNVPRKTICTPKMGISVGELKEVFLKYYNQNKPLSENVLASQLIYSAMAENYPCKDGK